MFSLVVLVFDCASGATITPFHGRRFQSKYHKHSDIYLFYCSVFSPMSTNGLKHTGHYDDFLAKI